MSKGTLNKVMLIGRSGADPELKYAPSGAAVVNFSIATVQAWKNQAGEQQEKTEWHRCVAWRQLAEIIGEYVKKGSRVYVEGQLETRSWEDDSGNKKYMTEIVVKEVEFLQGRQETGEQAPVASEPPKEQPPVDKPPVDDLPF